MCYIAVIRPYLATLLLEFNTQMTDPFEKSTVAEPIRDAIRWLSFPDRTKKSLFLDALNELLDDIALSSYDPTGRESLKAYTRLRNHLDDEQAQLEAEKEEIRSIAPSIEETDESTPDVLPEINEEEIDESEFAEDTPPLPSEIEREIDKESSTSDET